MTTKKLVKSWQKEFKKENQEVKLEIFTPSIRKGFWNIMAWNLSIQTYKNFTWSIVDDYPEDRSKIAKEYAKKYNLDIRYIRGKERKVKRRYALCNANNTILEKTDAEVLVFLQDFILIPEDGLEQIATLYRSHPRALQGLVDSYFTPKVKPNTDSEDWFNGELDVIGKFIRKNIRIQNEGLRKTDNPMDFEQNYGAIPVAIAKELGGWWEFYDEALGWDNTDIAYRALLKGYEILIDETNCAACIDHWEALNGTKENGGKERARRFNDPRYVWMKTLIKGGELPITRTQARDDLINLQYDIPKEVDDDHAEEWMKENLKTIVEKWIKDEFV